MNSALPGHRPAAPTEAAPPDTAEVQAILRAAVMLLRELRLAWGWTQTELGRRTGFPPEQICRFERGSRTPDLGGLVLLCRALGVRTSDLLRMAEQEACPLGLTPTVNVAEVVRRWREQQEPHLIAWVIARCHDGPSPGGGGDTRPVIR